MKTKIAKSINRGIDSLIKSQQKDGSLLSLSSPHSKSFTKAKKSYMIFPSFLVLSCLNALEETAKIKTIRRKVAKFLLSQKSEHWSFNYWARGSQEAKTRPYPDDLDDTFCALSALFQYNPKLIDGSAMAKIVTLLTAVEKKEGGPYRTWLVSQDADEVWKDVDLVANSNIAYFLSLQDISLQSIKALIESAIETENYTSPYYPSVYPIIYFISRFYKGKKTKKVRDFLLSKREANGKWENPQNTALAISSLFNLNTPIDKLEKSVVYLMRNQTMGSWKPYTFCIDLIVGKKKYYAGSSAVTTALCLEAMGKYQKQLSKIASAPVDVTKSQVATSPLYKKQAEKVYKEVVKQARQRFSSLNNELKIQALKCLEATLKKDKDKQIGLMPYFFNVSLGEKGKNVPKNLLIKLGLVNLYGWIAYSIYDDFLDDEGDPKLLSVANVCLRESTTIYNNILPKKTGFPAFMQEVVDTIDAANTWEVNHCRIKIKSSELKIQGFKIPDFGDFSRLAHRSLGHALGPAVILYFLGYNTSSPELKNLMRFFKHFLIARQLNDEAHDWEKDLKMGQINAVGAQILKKVKNKKLKVTVGQLQEVFWHKVVVDICQTILKHTQLSQKALKKISIITNPSLLEQLLIPIEYSVHKALKEREETLKFLRAYEKTIPTS